jgi:hypothetical protein
MHKTKTKKETKSQYSANGKADILIIQEPLIATNVEE